MWKIAAIGCRFCQGGPVVNTKRGDRVNEFEQWSLILLSTIVQPRLLKSRTRPSNYFQPGRTPLTRCLLSFQQHCHEWFLALSNVPYLKAKREMNFADHPTARGSPIVPESCWFLLVIASSRLDVPKSPSLMLPEISLRMFAPECKRGKNWHLSLSSLWRRTFDISMNESVLVQIDQTFDDLLGEFLR